MFLATSCNIACSIFVLLSITKINSESFFVMDWVVVTTILVRHCQNFGKNVSPAYHPKTGYMLHLSQIATAKSI
ncbi:hypothetical protein BDF19DRAFT_445286, partial [Syncephalis fuscata]